VAETLGTAHARGRVMVASRHRVCGQMAAQVTAVVDGSGRFRLKWQPSQNLRLVGPELYVLLRLNTPTYR
jgi:hypothetical protein